MNKMLILLTLFAGAVLGETIDVIILAGQSNAVGYPNLTDYGPLPSYLQTNYVHRSWYKANSHSWFDELLHPASTVYWGVELTGLDSIYQAYGKPLVLIKYGWGGTSLAYDWQQGDRCYVGLTNYIQTAKKQLESEGYTLNWRQFWWIQGEQDTTNQAMAEAYSANFEQFWSDLCADTGLDTNISIIIAPLSSLYGGNYAPIVKTNQAYLAATHSNIQTVSVESLEWYSGVHYSAQSLMTLGERFAICSIKAERLDADSDGILDYWEMQNGLSPTNASDAFADWDSDGMNNRGEYLAGTNPTNPASFLAVECAVLSDGRRNLSWYGVQGRYYTLQYADSLPSNVWTAHSPEIPGADETISVIDSETAPRRCYRVNVRKPD